MYNTHPTTIDQNSRFYNESAKLACIINDISAKQESIITRSVSETGRKGAGFGTVEETQRVGRYNLTPMPEAHEPRVGLAVQLAIFIRGCEPEGVFIDLTIQLKNAPSSEPDAGERRVPYYSGTVGRTITGRMWISTALARTRPRWTRIPMD